MVDAKVVLEFNVNLEKLIKDEIKLKQLKDTNKPFMTIQSDITSNYHQFSTIKLIEMRLDAKSRLLKKMHDPIVLCSQNPYINKIPCYSENSPLLSIKYTKVTEMSSSFTSTTSSQYEENHDMVFEKNEKQDSSSSNNVKTNSTTYDLSYSNRGKSYEIKEFIEGIRIYNILFYKQNEVVNQQQETSENDNERQQKLVFEETIALSVNPNKCN